MRGDGDRGGGRGGGVAGSFHSYRRGSSDLGGGAPITVVAVENGLQGVTQIAQQMPAVGDLGSSRRSGADAFGIGARAVAGHDGDARVGLQPSRDRLRLSIRQQLDGAVAFQIDDERAIAPAAAPSPVVDADDPRRWPWLGSAAAARRR